MGRSHDVAVNPLSQSNEQVPAEKDLRAPSTQPGDKVNSRDASFCTTNKRFHDEAAGLGRRSTFSSGPARRGVPPLSLNMAAVFQTESTSCLSSAVTADIVVTADISEEFLKPLV